MFLFYFVKKKKLIGIVQHLTSQISTPCAHQVLDNRLSIE